MLGGFLWVTNQEEKEQCFSVRQQVFVEEQGFQDEFDAIDQDAYHLLFLDDEKPVGTARLFWDHDVWHIGRVCTLKAYRGEGIGKFLVEECARKATELKRSDTVVLGAQLQAEAFYQKIGFAPFGEIFDDQGCPHIMMKKILAD